MGFIVLSFLAFSITTGVAGCVPTTLSITFDNYPEETSWDIKDGSDNIVFAGGTYGAQADGATLTIDNCLDVGCYTLTMYDAYGDGICCAYGSGSYSMVDDNGTLLASGSSFNASESTAFCVGGASNFAALGTVEHEYQELEDVRIFPNPASSILEVRLRDKRMVTYSIYDVMGNQLKQGFLSEKSIEIQNFVRGVYFIEFASDKKALVRKFVKN